VQGNHSLPGAFEGAAPPQKTRPTLASATFNYTRLDHEQISGKNPLFPLKKIKVKML
jgi:hypothetical protein